MCESNSRELLSRVRTGDTDAEVALHDRFLLRLIALAQSRLSGRLAVRVDPEDIVQSAYRSFFLRARKGEFLLERAGDLWRLLAQITLNKLRSQAAHHTAAKRSINQEEITDVISDESRSLGNEFSGIEHSEPSHEEAVATIEVLEQVMSELTSISRHALELRLQGRSIPTIAHDLERSEWTVRRLLQQVEAILAQRLSDESC